MFDIKQLIKQSKANVFRRCYIKRRQTSDGLFESEWQEITDDVKKWGTVRISSDFARRGFYRFNPVSMVMANDLGRYNAESSDSSLWYGYLRQRTLLKIEAGYEEYTSSSGVWTRTELPSVPTMFVGLVSGDFPTSEGNEVVFDVKPLTKVFEDFPVSYLTFLTTGAITASDFITGLMNQTDGAGNYYFRPFFGDTTTNWNIDTTTTYYYNMQTATTKALLNKSVWQVVEKLAEAEDFLAYVDRQGVFNFVARPAGTTSSFSFYGIGFNNTEYGQTIKKVNQYFEEKVTDYYSRVEVKFNEDNTTTSYVTTEASLQISGINNPWNFGFRTYSIENTFINNTVSAQAVAAQIFADVSSVKKEIDFSATFIPHLNFTETIDISYDSTSYVPESLWDLNDWDTELIWDGSKGDAIVLENEEFNILELSQNIDAFETKIKARET